MAKELPYFKFEPSKWDNGNIQLCSFEAQGMFINLCCIYWSRIGDLPLKLAEQKLFKSNADAYTELMQEQIFEVNEGKIVINFLDEQLSNFGGLSESKSKAAKVRWDKVRENKQVNADALHMQCKSNAIREEKIRKEEIKKDDISFKKETKDNYLEIDFGNFILFWNKKVEKSLIPKIDKLTEKRKKSLRSLFQEFSKEKFAEVLNIALKSDFLTGKTKEGFVLTFDFFSNKNNFIKVMEGNYANKENPNTKTTKIVASTQHYEKPLEPTEEEKIAFRKENGLI